MASNVINGKTTTAIVPTKPQIEGVQSITPFKITTPRMVRRVSLPASLGLFKGSLNVLLYYNNDNNNTTSDQCRKDSDSGSIHAGWIKESLARALTEQPLLAGRFQSKGSQVVVGGDDHDQEIVMNNFEVVSNDSGVRLVESRVNSVTLDDYFKSNVVMDEAELVFWKDVDEIDPQFSPPFYVQVTKFECGGYSFGISCSIFLADLLLKGNFFKRWAEIHNNLLTKNNNTNVLEKPLFYLPNLKKEPNSTIGNIFNTTASKDLGQTNIFDVTCTEPSDQDSLDEISTLAMHCVKEAERKVEKKSDSEFILLSFASEPKNLAQIKKLSRHGLVVRPSANQVKCSSWDDFEGNDLQFCKGNQPVRVSHWIGSVSTDQLVIGFPYCYGSEGARGLKFIVRLTST